MRVIPASLLAGLTLLAGLGLPRSAPASVRRVPQDHATIGAALAAASPGDIVQVAAGTYTPATNGETYPLTIDKDGIQLLGAGRGVSVLDAEGTGSVILHTASSGGRVAGFTSTGGLSPIGGGGIRVAAGNPEIADNTLSGNGAPIRGAALLVSGSAAPWIHHNLIWENVDSDSTDSLDPHGLGYLDSAAGMVEHNVLGRTDGNGLITNGSAAPTVRNNIFFENGRPSATLRGRGICWLSSPAPESARDDVTRRAVLLP